MGNISRMLMYYLKLRMQTGYKVAHRANNLKSFE